MTTNTKLEEREPDEWERLTWEQRFDTLYPDPLIQTRTHDGTPQGVVAKFDVRKQLKTLIAQERAQVVKECMAVLPEADTSTDADSYERADRIAWNAYRTAALDALQKIAQGV